MVAWVLLDIIVHQHLVQHVHHEHLGGMRLQIQRAVECLQVKCLAWRLLEHVHEQALQVFLLQALARLLVLSHSSIS